MIDLHCHLLPGIDDGPAHVGESIDLAERAAADGVRTVVATPHLREDYPLVRPTELASRCVEVSDALAERDIELEVVPGGEVDVLWAQEASTEDLTLVSYGQRGTDLLVETPYGFLPDTFEELLFRVAVRGFRITLAHPERNPTYQDDPERLARVVEQGVLVQLTASGVANPRRGSHSSRLGKWLVERGIAHVVASDAHGGRALREPLSQAVAALTPVAGERARWMVEAAPAAVLAGEPLPEAPQEPASGSARRRWRPWRTASRGALGRR